MSINMMHPSSINSTVIVNSTAKNKNKNENRNYSNKIVTHDTNNKDPQLINQLSTNKNTQSKKRNSAFNTNTPRKKCGSSSTNNSVFTGNYAAGKKRSSTNILDINLNKINTNNNQMGMNNLAQTATTTAAVTSTTGTSITPSISAVSNSAAVSSTVISTATSTTITTNTTSAATTMPVSTVGRKNAGKTTEVTQTSPSGKATYSVDYLHQVRNLMSGKPKQAFVNVPAATLNYNVYNPVVNSTKNKIDNIIDIVPILNDNNNNQLNSNAVHHKNIISPVTSPLIGGNEHFYYYAQNQMNQQFYGNNQISSQHQQQQQHLHQSQQQQQQHHHHQQQHHHHHSQHHHYSNNSSNHSGSNNLNNNSNSNPENSSYHHHSNNNSTNYHHNHNRNYQNSNHNQFNNNNNNNNNHVNKKAWNWNNNNRNKSNSNHSLNNKYQNNNNQYNNNGNNNNTNNNNSNIKHNNYNPNKNNHNSNNNNHNNNNNNTDNNSHRKQLPHHFQNLVYVKENVSGGGVSSLSSSVVSSNTSPSPTAMLTPSSTPSPQSESPPIAIKIPQSTSENNLLQKCNDNNKMMNHMNSGTAALLTPISLMQSAKSTPSITTNSLDIVLNPNHTHGLNHSHSHNHNSENNKLISNNNNNIVHNNTNSIHTINDYESDSSHSSNNRNFSELYYRTSSEILTNFNQMSSNEYLAAATSPIIANNNNLRHEDHVFRGHLGYYGSQQNLHLWNHNLSHTMSGNNSLYNSNGSLELALQYAASTESDNYGHHRKRYSGRSSPSNNSNSSNPNQRKMNRNGGHRSNNLYYRVNSYQENSYTVTPPDRFLARSHLIEMRATPKSLLNSSQWDPLSKSIWSKFSNSQQTEETYKRKMYLWRYLYLCIRKSYPRYGLYLVGSTISGFGSDNSDVDMCLVSRYVNNIDPRVEAVLNLTDLKNYLINTTATFEQFHLIQAKVPILRFKDISYSLEVDLNFNNSVGVCNTHLLYCYTQMDWRLRPLALVIKLWAQFHHINNAKNMTISSYSLVLMVIHFLQCGISPPVLPCLHSMYPDKFQKYQDISNIDMNEDLEPYYSDNNMPIGELLVKFLEYYSNFDYTQYAISVRTASILSIEDCKVARSYKNDPHQWKQLCIEEPFDLTNTARSVYDGEIFERIKAIFQTSWQLLKKSNDLNSIFTAQSYLPITSVITPSITTSSSSVSSTSNASSTTPSISSQLTS